MSVWRRSILSGRYTNGDVSFVAEPDGPAGDFVYSDGSETYEVPYEYGTGRALFAIWPDFIKLKGRPAAAIPKQKRLEICANISAAIREVHKKDVLLMESDDNR